MERNAPFQTRGPGEGAALSCTHARDSPCNLFDTVPPFLLGRASIASFRTRSPDMSACPLTAAREQTFRDRSFGPSTDTVARPRDERVMTAIGPTTKRFSRIQKGGGHKHQAEEISEVLSGHEACGLHRA